MKEECLYCEHFTDKSCEGGRGGCVDNGFNNFKRRKIL